MSTPGCPPCLESVGWGGAGGSGGGASPEPLLRTLAQPGQGLPAAPGTGNGWNLTLKEGRRGHCRFVCFTGHFPSWKKTNQCVFLYDLGLD